MLQLSDFVENARNLTPQEFAERYPYPFLVRAVVPLDSDASEPKSLESTPVKTLLSDELKTEVIPIIAKLESRFKGDVTVGKLRSSDIVLKNEDDIYCETCKNTKITILRTDSWSLRKNS